MQSKNNKPTAHAKRWQQAVRNAGCVITGNSQVQVHHCGGASLRHNKTRIGHYAVLALSPELHDVGSNHPLNVTHHKKAFHAKYGTNAQLFKRTMQLVSENSNADVLPPQDVINAILDWGMRY